ncbi:MAG: prepilin-type N-terminal cleavage/methylation domain-containing protein, partial [Thermodesulfovibrionales bacterium]
CQFTSDPGFTLLELVVVIFVLSLVLALSLPSFTGIGESKIQSDAKRLASILRYLNDSAISTKESLYLKVNFQDKTIHYNGPDGEKTETFDALSDIELQSKGTVSEGEATVFFGPSGASESLQMHLRSDKQDLTIALNALSGRVKITKNEQT